MSRRLAGPVTPTLAPGWWSVALLFGLALGPALAAPAPAATLPGPPVGAWATYRWTSSVSQEVPVVVQQPDQTGRISWSVTRESVPPPPLFVTYAVVAGNPRTYTLQIVTQATLDGPPLAITHVTIDRASGKAVRSVTRRPQGVIDTPESGLRPFRESAAKGTAEPVTVAAGRFTAIRAPYRDGTVWVSDQIPALGLVKATFPTGTLELIRSGAMGAKDLLRS